MGIPVNDLANESCAEPEFGGGDSGSKDGSRSSGRLVRVGQTKIGLDDDSEFQRFEDTGRAPIGLDERLLHSLGVSPDDVRLYKSEGSFAENEIRPRDWLLIDVTQTESSSAGLYCIFDEDSEHGSPYTDFRFFHGKPQKVSGRVLLILRRP